LAVEIADKVPRLTAAMGIDTQKTAIVQMNTFNSPNMGSKMPANKQT